MPPMIDPDEWPHFDRASFGPHGRAPLHKANVIPARASCNRAHTGFMKCLALTVVIALGSAQARADNPPEPGSPGESPPSETTPPAITPLQAEPPRKTPFDRG